MPSDFSVLMAFVLTVLWAAISLPLQIFNPLKFSDDEKTTGVLVYVVAPFIFFSGILIVAIVMRKRSQTREETRGIVEEAELKMRKFTQSKETPLQGGLLAYKYYVQAKEAFEKGAHEEAERYAGRINDLVKYEVSRERRAGPRELREPAV
jgi:hypothetical protein